MTREHHFNPQLEIINKDFPGNLSIDGTFTNSNSKEKPLFKEVLRFFFSPNPQKKEKKDDPFKVQVIKGKSFLDSTEDMIVWLGHSSFFIRINGISMLTDPVFFSLPFIPRLAEIPCMVTDFKGIDYILLSHCHRDHFDIKTLKILCRENPHVTFLAPLNAGNLLKKVKPGLKIQEAAWYQRFKVKNDVAIDFLPAVHWNRRGLLDFNKELWGSFMISAGEKKVYFAGDTADGAHFKEIGSLYGSSGIVLMPIGAYKPDYIMKHYHISPQDAFRAFVELKGELFLPMHYGTYDLANEPLGEPVRLIKDLFKSERDKLMVPDIGEMVSV